MLDKDESLNLLEDVDKKTGKEKKNELIKEYQILEEKCNTVISRIKARKNKN